MNNSSEKLYDEAFYKSQKSGSYESAKVVLPYLVDNFSIKSMIDFGCGAGTWLKVATECGINDIQGLDFGDNRNQLLIPENMFKSKDLSKSIDLKRKFDLVLSCEVAEHISSDYAQTFVDNLCRRGDFIVFSAAIPGQFGTGHINEQWPSYWKKLFENNGYEMQDVLRSKFWNDTRIEVCYRQNLLVFTSKNFDKKIDLPKLDICDIVHPEYFVARSERVVELKEQRISNRLKRIFK